MRIPFYRPLRLLGALLLCAITVVPWSVDRATSSVLPTTTQILALESGWNLFSMPVDPPSRDLGTVLAPLAGQYDRVLGMENGTQVVFDPANPGGSTLQTFDPVQGYYIHMLTAGTLSLTGTEVPPTTAISLTEGENLIAYLPTVEQPVQDAIGSVIGQVDYIRTIDLNGRAHGQGADGGLTYDPLLPQFSTLKTLQPGFGYQIKVRASQQMQYPADPGLADLLVAEGQEALEDGDLGNAGDEFAEALGQNQYDPEANTGMAMVTLAEQSESTQTMVEDTHTLQQNVDFPNLDLVEDDALALLDSSPLLPFVTLSEDGTPAQGFDLRRTRNPVLERLADVLTTLQTGKSARAEQELPNIGATIVQFVFDMFLNVTCESKQVFSLASVNALQELIRYADQIQPILDQALGNIRTAEQNPSASFRISANGFDGLSAQDLNGDGTADTESGAGDDYYLIDQGDLYILDGILSLIREDLKFARAYNFEVPPNFQPTNDGMPPVTINEYFPPAPLFIMNAGWRETLMSAGPGMLDAVQRLIHGIELTLAEPIDDHEFFPVNTDPDVRASLEEQLSDAGTFDLTDTLHLLAGPTLLNLSQAPLHFADEAINIDFQRLFADPPEDLRAFLYAVDCETRDVVYEDPTWNGIWPDGDVDGVLERMLTPVETVEELEGEGILAITEFELESFFLLHGDVYVLNADGSGKTNLTNNQATLDALPSFSHDRTKIAFYSNRAYTITASSSDILIMNVDGSDVQNLTFQEGAEDKEDSFPEFALDDQSLFFQVDDFGSEEHIFTINVDGTNRQPVPWATGPFDFIETPRLSPDGTRLAVGCERSDELFTRVCLFNTDGSNAGNPFIVSPVPADDTDDAGGANWSPDGTQLVYQMEISGTTQLFRVNADGTDVTQLTMSDGGAPTWLSGAFSPVFSPDGQFIAFASDRDGVAINIFVMRADGSETWQVTHNTLPQRLMFVTDWVAGEL